MNYNKNRILLIYPNSEIDFDLKLSNKKPVFSKIVMSIVNFFSKVIVFESTQGQLVPPLGLVNLATITPQKWRIQIHDERIEQIDDKLVTKFIKNYDVIGITGFTANIGRAYYLANIFKESGKKVVIGGYHASLLSEEALKYCDTVITGFGELSWLEFLNDYENNNTQSIYQSTKMRFVNPNWNLIKKEHYLSTNFVEVSRGCHNMCSFCCINSFHKFLQYRDVDEVISELKKCKNRLVILVSDNLTSNKKYCKTLFEKIIANNLNINIVANLSHEFAYDEVLVKLAAKAGLKSALIGFETINSINKEKISKNKTVNADYEKCIRLLHKYKIGITGCFIVGFEGDTQFTVSEISRFSKKNKLECLRISPLIPYPGTPIFNQLSALNKIQHKDWNEYHTYGKQSIYQNPSEFSKIRIQLFKTLKKNYSLFAIFLRIVNGMKYKSYYIPYNLSQWYKHNFSLAKDQF
jgi:radical SAM superfamily enzyme YgiQ (UPF0313 family)